MTTDTIICIITHAIQLVIIIAASIKVIHEEKITEKRAADFLRSDLQKTNDLFEERCGEKMWDIEREVQLLKTIIKL